MVNGRPSYPKAIHPIARHKPSPEQSAAQVEKILVMLGIPLMHLGRLLGVAELAEVYRYRSGLRRPSTLTLMRCTELLWLKIVEGVHPYRIKSIDWEKGIRYMKDGSEKTFSSKDRHKDKPVSVPFKGRRMA